MADLGLEELLQRNERSYFAKNSEISNNPSSIQTAEKSASLFDLMKMINKLVTLTMSDLSVEFIPDEGRVLMLNVNQQLDHPTITYKLINREPKTELKPRQRQVINEKTENQEDERIGEVYGQKFKCLVQFNIFASVYTTAEEVMERFEELMFTYAGYFKKNGISEILFQKQLNDQSFDTFRQTISVRNVQYYTEVEKLTVLFREKIKDIEIISGLEGYTEK